MEIEKIEKNKIIKTVRPFFEDIDAYVVGGFLRDLALEKESSDVDFAVQNSSAKEIALTIADSLDGHFVPLDETNKIYRVVLQDKKTYLDIAQCAGKNISQDLKRRDFTLNALGYDLKNRCVLDVCSSLDDIKKGVIRQISEKNIVDDPLRIIRAFRFQSETGFEIEDETLETIKKHAQKLSRIAKERVNLELTKLFGGAKAHCALVLMDETKVLEHLIPEVEEIKKIPPNSHHHLNLFFHCVETVKKVQEFYELAPREVCRHFEEELFGGQKRICYLKLAAFLHDLGKPSTWQIEPETGKHRFIKHDEEGSKLAAPLLKNLKFSKKQIQYVQKLIKYHIYPSNVVTGKGAKEKAQMRFFRKADSEVFDLIAIARADRLSALGPEINQSVVEKNLEGLNLLMTSYLKLQNEIKPLPKLLNGNEIMEILKIKAGPQLGSIVKALNEAQISGEVNTKEEAAAFVKSFKL